MDIDQGNLKISYMNIAKALGIIYMVLGHAYAPNCFHS